MNCEAAPAATQTCWDCGQEIGASEKTCPKCHADIEAAKEEDSLIERALKRLAAKKKKTRPAPDTPAATTTPVSRFKTPGLAKLFPGKKKE
jgi:hypothetical protein